MPMCSRLDDEITRIAYKLDDEINRRSLTSIPLREWSHFSIAVNCHILFASLLFISGCVCFCVSLQFSKQFDAVNCSDGLNIFPPMLNMISAFTGLFTLRTLHLKWPAFIHLISTLIVFPLNVVTAVDLVLNSLHWYNYWSRYPSVAHDEDSTIMASSFLWMDICIGIVAFLNDLAIAFVVYIYFKFWYSIRSNTA